MMKRMYIGTLLVVSMALAGCGGSAPESTTAGGNTGVDEKPVVALIMKSLANEFFKTMEDGARALYPRRRGDQRRTGR